MALTRRPFPKLSYNSSTPNSSKDFLLHLPLHPLIVSSSFRLPAAKLGIDIFGKDNVGKDRGDDLGSTGADVDRRTKVNDPSMKTDANVVADNLGTAADNPSTAIDHPGIAADNLSIAANDPGIATDDPGITADNLGTGIDTDAEADNRSTVASNKVRVASFFTLCHTLFLRVFSSKSVIASLPSSLPSSSLITLLSKPVSYYSMTSVKQRASSSKYLVDKM